MKILTVGRILVAKIHNCVNFHFKGQKKDLKLSHLHFFRKLWVIFEAEKEFFMIFV